MLQILPNIAIHLSRLRRALSFADYTLRPGDGERSKGAHHVTLVSFSRQCDIRNQKKYNVIASIYSIMSTDLDELTLEQFSTLMYGETEQKTEMASCLVDFIAAKNEETQVSLIAYLLENYGIPGRGSGRRLVGRKITYERYTELALTLDDLIHGQMRLIIHTRRSYVEAAQIIRDLIFSFDDPDQRDYCLAEIMADEAVPYRAIPQSTMKPFSSERLGNIRKERIDEIAQIRAIWRTGMDTTTQAELMLSVLDVIVDKEERVGVFEMAIIIYFREKLKRAEERR
jgi:hypothetical protein